MIKCENPVCNNLIDERKRVKRYCSRNCNNHHYGMLNYEKYNPKKPKHKQKCGNPKCNKMILTTGFKKYCDFRCHSLAQYYRRLLKKIRNRTP